MYRAASALTGIGIVLVVANWYGKREAALAWMGPLAMFALMAAALRMSWLAVRRSPAQATAARSLDWTTTAVVFAARMMGIPLALTLARAYGGLDDIGLGRRSTGVLSGAFLVAARECHAEDAPVVLGDRM